MSGPEPPHSVNLPISCVNWYERTMRTVDSIATKPNCAAVSRYHPQRTFISVIPGLTRNPGFLSGFPLSRNDVVEIARFMQRLGLLSRIWRRALDANDGDVSWPQRPDFNSSRGPVKNPVGESAFFIGDVSAVLNKKKHTILPVLLR